MYFSIGQLRNVSELDSKFRLVDLEKGILDRRKQISIAVIDDKEFAPLENLQRNNYQITRFPDIPTLEAVRDYQIVLCDLLGVGQQLNPSLQGAHIIREIKRHYPDKYIVAYTGGSASSALLTAAVALADKYVQKDTAIEEWCDLLDTAIKALANPIDVWRKMRKRLLDAGITPYELAKLEDCFVRSFDISPDEYKTALPKLTDQLNLKGDIRSIVNSLVANTIFAIGTVLIKSL